MTLMQHWNMAKGYHLHNNLNLHWFLFWKMTLTSLFLCIFVYVFFCVFVSCLKVDNTVDSSIIFLVSRDINTMLLFCIENKCNTMCQVYVRKLLKIMSYYYLLRCFGNPEHLKLFWKDNVASGGLRNENISN